MKFGFVAGFGPIVRDVVGSKQFWADAGFALSEIAPDYYGDDDKEGVKAFAAVAAGPRRREHLWQDRMAGRRAGSAGLDRAGRRVGRCRAQAATEMVGKGHRLIREAREEPWKQTTARLLAPEGLLVGISYTPWMHKEESSND